MPKPTDWPAHIDVCGFFFRAPPDFTPPADLAAFLQSGPPPVYIGFGSIVIEDPLAMTATLVKAVRSWGGRAIISRGWSKLGEEESDDQIFYLEDCPHEWLFQKVAAVVHHGGAGTTACGLRFGRPSLIVPFFGEYVIPAGFSYLFANLSQSAILGKHGRVPWGWTNSHSTPDFERGKSSGSYPFLPAS